LLIDAEFSDMESLFIYLYNCWGGGFESKRPLGFSRKKKKKVSS